jgi:hypothetical protein
VLEVFQRTHGRRSTTGGADKGYCATAFQAAPHTSQCGHSDGTGGGPSAGETDGPDRGLAPRATGAQKDRSAGWRGERLAGVPLFSTTGPPAGQRRGRSDGGLLKVKRLSTWSPAPVSGAAPTVKRGGRDGGEKRTSTILPAQNNEPPDPGGVHRRRRFFETTCVSTAC